MWQLSIKRGGTRKSGANLPGVFIPKKGESGETVGAHLM
jgi:hypothetical protein